MLPERTKPDDLLKIRVLGNMLYLSAEAEGGAFAAGGADRQLALAANPDIGSLAGGMVGNCKTQRLLPHLRFRVVVSSA